MLFLTITSMALLGHAPPVCLYHPNVRFFPLPHSLQVHWLFVVFFFRDRSNLALAFRAFAHSLTPILAIRPP